MQAWPQKESKRKESSQHARSHEEWILIPGVFGSSGVFGHLVFLGCFLALVLLLVKHGGAAGICNAFEVCTHMQVHMHGCIFWLLA